jgi:hypothetical protein
MNINRHNYEEYFLLYVDRELTAEQRMMVEEFVAANPDLKMELQLLQQTILYSDVKLDDSSKSKLLKEEELKTVTEEQLLLLLDNELNKDEAVKVNKAIAADARLQNDWAWLQRSKITPDTSIVFPDKSLLYKDAQPARVFYLSSTVKRWSAAAAVLFMLGTGYWIYNKQETTQSIVETRPVSVDQPSTTGNTSSADSNNPTTVPNQSSVQQQKKNEQSLLVTNNPSSKKSNTIQTTAIEQKNNSVAVQTTKPQEQLPVVQQPEQKLQSQDAIVKTDTKADYNGNNLPISSVQPSTNIAASSVSYINNDEESAEDEQEGLFNENRQRSSGLKALVKRAKRTLERRTGIQSGESQVRFAVFTVNTQ